MTKQKKLKQLKYKRFKWYLFSILGYISLFNLLVYISDNRSTFNHYDWLVSIILTLTVCILTCIFVHKEDKIISQYYRILVGDEE